MWLVVKKMRRSITVYKISLSCKRPESLASDDCLLPCAADILRNCFFCFQLADMLKRKDVDVNVRTNEAFSRKETALHVASRNDQLEAVTFLVANGGDVNLRGLFLVFLQHYLLRMFVEVIYFLNSN